MSERITSTLRDLINNRKHDRLHGYISSGLHGYISSGLSGDISGLHGDISGLSGDISGLRGDSSGLSGYISGLHGDILAGKYPGIFFIQADAKEIARLDKVRAIVLAKPERLDMSTWHSHQWTPEHTPKEEHSCGSAHCIAGWLQALSPSKKIRQEMSAEEAGRKLAPASSFMFYTSDAVALEWLKNREYAKHTEVK